MRRCCRLFNSRTVNRKAELYDITDPVPYLVGLEKQRKLSLERQCDDTLNDAILLLQHPNV